MMLEAEGTTNGLVVLHLFCKHTAAADNQAVIDQMAAAQAQGVQIVTVAVLGHKADICFMALHRDGWLLRDLQTSLSTTGLAIVDSFVSITELSEYALGLSEDVKNARLYPQLPPNGKGAWCFYPMTKRRTVNQNWYRLPFEQRKELMYEHGASGRKFAGRIVQLVTASTGLDDWEWGVTLFARNIDDLKDTVYTMRYDTASAIYAEFGAFYCGLVGTTSEVVSRVTGTNGTS